MPRQLSIQRTDHRFFFAMTLLLIAYAVLGFWHSYLGAGLVRAPLPSLLVHVHAVLFVGWLALLAIQIILVCSGRLRTRRQIGTAMGFWAAAMVLVGPATTVMALRRPRSGVNAAVLAGDLAVAIALALLVGAGLARRRNPAAHKRLMLLTTCLVIAPAIIRWPFDAIQNGPPFLVFFFYLLPPLILAGYDLLTLRRVQRETWLGIGLAALVLLAFGALPAWGAWTAFADWLRRA